MSLIDIFLSVVVGTAIVAVILAFAAFIVTVFVVAIREITRR